MSLTSFAIKKIQSSDWYINLYIIVCRIIAFIIVAFIFIGMIFFAGMFSIKEKVYEIFKRRHC